MKRNFIVIVFVVLTFILFSTSAFGDVTPPDNVNKIGSYVVFGAYDQALSTLDEKGNAIDQLRGIDNGPEPIQWIVLAQDGNKLLLLSQDPLDYQQFHKERKNITWKTSSIRTWLNSTFLRKAFTVEEQEAILITEIITGGENIEKNWEISYEEVTNDQIFLLSNMELRRYLNNDKIKVNEYVDDNDGIIFGKDDSWWLRSMGKKTDEACYVGHNKNESGWVSDWRGIRPAMWIDITLINWDKTNYSNLKQAQMIAKDPEKLPEAFAITDSLGNYMNSKLLSMQYRVDYAKYAAKDGNYDEAIKRLTDAKNFARQNYTGKTASDTDEYIIIMSYFDLNETLVDCKYLLAVQKKDEGDYQTAIQMFTDIGQYRDSMKCLRECFDKTHIQYSWLTGPYDVVNAGLDKEFSETNSISGNDPHFGWSLGRFMMSGFTEEKNGSVPVFMKTPGDSLILWFDLEQDINKLNGNKDLTINRDDNGSDRQFQISKSNFGKGMLLVRHTDFRKNVSPAQIYADFLMAHEDTGANTKVEIKEEGTYEVALDYEIKKDELFDKYYNYKISFKFEVRNGSGMFFMFDVATGSELQDYSRTADGFRIDLANSHSLSVSYTRYAINQAETGLDVRKTGLASDGDTFEKVGYYVITVTNKETNEELTKHIFVGRAADLEEYQALDESLNKFSK